MYLMAELRSLPADITVFAGRFGAFPAAQPLVFAHLWDIAPDLDLDHVEVVPAKRAEPRLAAHLDEATINQLHDAAGDADTLVLLLPDAYAGLRPPDLASEHLRPLGSHRGQVRRLVGGQKWQK
jgi:hypothetical protein